ncbi:hypothetical protein G4B88_009661 [Cannabis sativa]|uniref:DUF1985 domain-containing protein n=1 Tax=Cannabis sativa TaxID=3483 RepID=A0A7J6EEB4_CANSA|nr:hypothetical protein G4B88_009661 [Cannabis sativa]
MRRHLWLMLLLLLWLIWSTISIISHGHSVGDYIVHLAWSLIPHRVGHMTSFVFSLFLVGVGVRVGVGFLIIVITCHYHRISGATPPSSIISLPYRSLSLANDANEAAASDRSSNDPVHRIGSLAAIGGKPRYSSSRSQAEAETRRSQETSPIEFSSWVDVFLKAAVGIMVKTRFIMPLARHFMTRTIIFVNNGDVLSIKGTHQSLESGDEGEGGRSVDGWRRQLMETDQYFGNEFECGGMAITRSSISPSPSGSKRKDVGDEEGNVRKMSLGDDKSDDSVSRDVVNERRSKKSNDPVSKDVVNEKSKKINEKVAESVKKSSVSSLAKKKSRVPDIVPDDRKSKKLKLKSVAEVDEGDLDSEDESSIAIPSKAKTFYRLWEFYLKPEERFCGKIIFWAHNDDVLVDIRAKLTEKQRAMFVATCFGHLLDIQSYKLQHQIFHTALNREVHQPNSKEMWFDFGHDRVRFGLGEFAVISGLLCKGDIDMMKYVGKGDVFVDKYFSDMTVTHGAVKQRFLSSTFKDDDFAVRMAVLYLVTNYLLSKPPDKHVSSGEFDSFPWGKVVYDTTLYYLRLGLKVTPVFPSAEENEKFDLTGFNFSYFSLSDDDFESVKVPKRQLDKGESSGVKEKVTVGGPMFDDVKHYVMRIINKQSEIGSSLKELRKDIDDKFVHFESKMKAHIDSKIEEGLVLYLDKKFSDLNDVLEGLKDCVNSQDDGEGNGAAVDDLGGVKDDGAEVYKEIRQISDAVVNEVVVQAGDQHAEDCMDKVGNDRPSFDIMGSLLAQSENVVDLLEDKKIVGDDNVIEASKRDSESTDDGITSAEMLIISEKVDAVCHDYELKKSMEKSKVIDLGSAGTPRDLEGVIRIDFGDSSGKSDKIGETKYLKGLHPFNSELLDPPHCLQQDSFDEWFLDGFNDQNKYGVIISSWVWHRKSDWKFGLLMSVVSSAGEDGGFLKSRILLKIALNLKPLFSAPSIFYLKIATRKEKNTVRFK